MRAPNNYRVQSSAANIYHRSCQGEAKPSHNASMISRHEAE